jgi:hypothetical protein
MLTQALTELEPCMELQGPKEDKLYVMELVGRTTLSA